MLRWRICRKRRARPGPTANPIAAIRVNEPLMNSFKFALPIDDALPALTAALAARDAAVLVAPPGAGKTTRVPLVLAEEPWAQGRTILVLEPRRIAPQAGTPGREIDLDFDGFHLRLVAHIDRDRLLTERRYVVVRLAVERHAGIVSGAHAGVRPQALDAKRKVTLPQE